jgi:predicted metal-dependent hydrolase
MLKVITHPAIGEVTLSRTRRAVRIALSVRPNGSVRLSFPTWVTQRSALAFLDEKAAWIAAGRARMAEKYPPTPPPTEAEKAANKRRVEELRREAKQKLPEMTRRLAAEHGFRHGEVRVKATRSKWGSCTARNDINLSLFLVQLPEHLVEYIVLHELCHTVHKNHSPRFHALLDHVTGGRSRALNRELRQFRPDDVI